jgi:hypothetical protein
VHDRHDDRIEVEALLRQKKLIENTNNAVARGTFGSPTFFVGNEIYFGGQPARRRRRNRSAIGRGAAQDRLNASSRPERTEPGRGPATGGVIGELAASRSRNPEWVAAPDP